MTLNIATKERNGWPRISMIHDYRPKWMGQTGLDGWDRQAEMDRQVQMDGIDRPREMGQTGPDGWDRQIQMDGIDRPRLIDKTRWMGQCSERETDLKELPSCDKKNHSTTLTFIVGRIL